VCGSDRLAISGLLRQVLRRWHLRDQVGACVEEDDVDVAVSFDLELGDLSGDAPDPAIESVVRVLGVG